MILIEKGRTSTPHFHLTIVHISGSSGGWLYQSVQVHFWTKCLGLNMQMIPTVLYRSLDPKMWVHLNNFLTLIRNTNIWSVNVVLNLLFQIQPHSDIWIIILRWRLLLQCSCNWFDATIKTWTLHWFNLLVLCGQDVLLA